MNRAIFITVGIVLVIIVFLLWLFLFVNGAPDNTREVFSDLGIVETSEREVDAQNPDIINDDGSVVLNLTDGVLQQITTSPIAGFSTASTSNGKNILRYVERGTGYIFEINLNSGLQTQVTPSTIPNTIEAYFSPDLEKVVIVSEREGRKVTLVELPNNSVTEVRTTTLSATAENIQFTNDETLTYTQNSPSATVAYTYNLDTKSPVQSFNLPIPDATVITTENNNIFAYPKPTALFGGALYEVTEGVLSPVSPVELGLVPFIGGGMAVINRVSDDDFYTSYALPNLAAQPNIMMPEKCTASKEGVHVWCGVPTNSPEKGYVEDWYKGVISSDDLFWDINTLTGVAVLLASPKNDIGRQLDVTNMTTDPSKEKLLFLNKIDSTLWLLSL